MRIHADPDPQPCFEHYFMCLTTKKTPHDFFSLNLVKLDLDLDPDPHSEKLLDPDPHKMNADPHSTALVYFMLIWIEVKTSIRIRIQMIVPVYRYPMYR